MLSIFLLSLLCGKLQLAADLQRHPSADLFKGQIENVIERSFSELQDKSIELRLFENEKRFFFYTFVENTLSPFSKRKYIIRINREILDDPPPLIALKAIFAHELQHLSDYTKMTAIELGWLALRYKLTQSAAFIAEFERETDRQVIIKGYGEGLKIYREWLYKKIPPEALLSKKENYLSPDEISIAESSLVNH